MSANAARPVICCLVGTRPEAIKVAPVVNALRADGRFTPVLIGSGQHVAPVDQALAPFGLVADTTLELNRTTGGLTELASLLLPAIDAELERLAPAAVVVQGDTSTAAAGALAGFWRGIPVVHIEAGLRSGDLASPFPEEGNRKIIDHLAPVLLAPTPAAARNLHHEGIPPERILVTGNTVVDAIREIVAKDLPFDEPRLAALESEGRRIVVVTVHRRESWGEPLLGILAAVRTLIDTHPDIAVVLPAHPNPAVRRMVADELAGVPRALVCDPLPYADMARLLARATLVLSDSGGIQEEAPSFGVPVLVLRDRTERPEAMESGWALLVGADPTRIVAEATALLAGPGPSPTAGLATNPFGDGLASRRTVEAIAWHLGMGERPEDFAPSAMATGAPFAPGGGGLDGDDRALHMVGMRGAPVAAGRLGVVGA